MGDSFVDELIPMAIWFFSHFDSVVYTNLSMFTAILFLSRKLGKLYVDWARNERWKLHWARVGFCFGLKENNKRLVCLLFGFLARKNSYCRVANSALRLWPGRFRKYQEDIFWLKGESPGSTWPIHFGLRAEFIMKV